MLECRPRPRTARKKVWRMTKEVVGKHYDKLNKKIEVINLAEHLVILRKMMDLLMKERVVLVNILVENKKENLCIWDRPKFIVSFIILFYSYFQGVREISFGGVNYF
jgi:hypothetical protein